MYTLYMNWNIADARSQFAKILELAKRTPQKLANRGRVQAVVVSAEAYAEFERWRQANHGQSLPEALAELRTLCAEERYTLPEAKRKDRKNTFIEALDELSR